jgi:Raf kinase inhibitor-like YbhB/YbcL family protein
LGLIVLLLVVVLGIATITGGDNASLSSLFLGTTPMTITSTAFAHNGTIPAQYTCDGENTSPPLAFTNVPEGAVSLVLTMDDPDIPQQVKDARGINVFDHWVVFNMPPDTTGIPEDAKPAGTEGANGTGSTGYTGPCPPKEYEPTEHRYSFKLYALDTELELAAGTLKADVEAAIADQILAKAELIGRYERP